jgi:nitrous oxide reductase accessory protein NosL
MTGSRRLTGLLAALLWALGPAGCGDAPSIAPPKILLGQDICDVCGMIISDDRFAAAVVVGQDAVYESRSFDDIGCLLSYEDAHPDETVAARYVRDFRTRTWRDAEAAVYVHSGHLHTPMAFGLAACGSDAEARDITTDYPGDVLDFIEVRGRYESGRLTIFPKQDSDA